MVRPYMKNKTKQNKTKPNKNNKTPSVASPKPIYFGAG